MSSPLPKTLLDEVFKKEYQAPLAGAPRGSEPQQIPGFGLGQGETNEADEESVPEAPENSAPGRKSHLID